MTSPITALDVRDFARTRNWKVVEEAERDRLIVLNSPDQSLRQLVMPIDADAPDYAEAVERALEKLAEAMHESVPRIRELVRTRRLDVQRYRIVTPGDDDAGLPLGFAEHVLAAARQLLASSGCTAVRPQLRHPRTDLSQARQVIEASTFRHTEPGSFVLNVSCPVDAGDESVEVDGVTTPLGRATTLTLFRGVRRLVDAIEVGKEQEFAETQLKSDKPLISSNLCDALDALHDERLGNSTELSFVWASERPIPASDAHLSSRIPLQPAFFPRIREVGQALRSLEPVREGVFVGTVEKLAGVVGADGRRSGEVQLSLLLAEDEAVRVKVLLDAAQYAEAARAHTGGPDYVWVVGRLFPGREPRRLEAVTRFRVMHRP